MCDFITCDELPTKRVSGDDIYLCDEHATAFSMGNENAVFIDLSEECGVEPLDLDSIPTAELY